MTVLLNQIKNLKILSEVTIPVKHCLLSRTTEIYSITGIIAHPKAIEQCKKFIENEMPYRLDIIEAASTEDAARQLQNYNLTYSIIGSEKTADTFYLNILKDNINDEENNMSRFVLIGDFEAPQTENDFTIVAFSTENKPGSLVKILQIFSKHNINITHVDSRPSPNFDEYIILAAFEGHIKDAKVQELIEELDNNTKFYKHIGSFENIK